MSGEENREETNISIFNTANSSTVTRSYDQHKTYSPYFLVSVMTKKKT